MKMRFQKILLVFFLKYCRNTLQFYAGAGKIGSGNIIAAGRRVLVTPHGPVRVNGPLSTVVSDYTTGLLYLFCPVFSRAGGEIACAFA